jgi:hypothetical protein
MPSEVDDDVVDRSDSRLERGRLDTVAPLLLPIERLDARVQIADAIPATSSPDLSCVSFAHLLLIHDGVLGIAGAFRGFPSSVKLANGC